MAAVERSCTLDPEELEGADDEMKDDQSSKPSAKVTGNDTYS